MNAKGLLIRFTVDKATAALIRNWDMEEKNIFNKLNENLFLQIKPGI